MSKVVKIVDDVNYCRGIVTGIRLAYEIIDKIALRVDTFNNSLELLREIEFGLENLHGEQLKKVGEKVCAQH